jgi:hypothetical protein
MRKVPAGVEAIRLPVSYAGVILDVVWVNTKSNIYHFAGRRDYGNTKQGAYMCQAGRQGGRRPSSLGVYLIS